MNHYFPLSTVEFILVDVTSQDPDTTIGLLEIDLRALRLMDAGGRKHFPHVCTTCISESDDSGDSGRTRVVTTRHDASRSRQQPLPPTTTTEGLRQPTTKTTDKDLDISRKSHPPSPCLSGSVLGSQVVSHMGSQKSMGSHLGSQMVLGTWDSLFEDFT